MEPGNGDDGDDADAPPTMDRAFWEERYRSAQRVWSGAPNPQLVAEVGDLEPGRALDVGAGEGADAIWLATRGWAVVAVDISDTALERGRQHALASDDDVAARIEWTQADLLEWAPPEGAFDLVSLQFLHLPADQRAVVYDRCAAAVAVGGVLLIVGHHPDDLQAPVRRPRWPEMYTTAEQLAAALGPGWEIVTAEARPRRVEGQDGAPVTVTDAVLLARRRPPEANHPPDGADTVA